MAVLPRQAWDREEKKTGPFLRAGTPHPGHSLYPKVGGADMWQILHGEPPLPPELDIQRDDLRAQIRPGARENDFLLRRVSLKHTITCEYQARLLFKDDHLRMPKGRIGMKMTKARS